MGIIRTEKLGYDYVRYSEDESEKSYVHAIDEIDIDIARGSFVGILGHNGSGKSTLARHINALLLPTRGTIWIDGEDTAKEPQIWKIRQKAGMVFQNPDNQIIGTTVEEDVGFGPENLGVKREEIWERVEKSLESVGMLKMRTMSPNRLSGGQKQRVAIAGIVSMQPDCIVLDEPTAMLDPGGRKEVLRTLHDLNRELGITVLLITHYMEEVTDADYLYVMDRGRLVMQGKPKEIFSRVDELRGMHLDVPQMTLLAHSLRNAGLDIPEGILTRAELREALLALRRKEGASC